MSKLFKLKEWLTVPETAKHLSGIFQEEVSEADVLRLALDRHIKISVLFVNPCMARRCPIIPTEKAKVVPSLDGERSVLLAYPLTPTECISMDGEIVKLRTDVWDLPMIRGEIDSVSQEYHRLTSGCEVTTTDIHGVFVQNEQGELFQVLSDFADTDDYKHIAKDCGIYDEKRYFPASRLPYDSMLVIMTKSITEFEQSIAESHRTENEIPRKERIKKFVNDAFAAGRTKESAYAELAEKEGCGVDNIKRIYKS